MSLPLSIAAFFVIWWIALFVVLPFGVRTQHEAGEVVPGTPASAPAEPRLLRVVLWTTVLAAVVLAALQAAIAMGLADWLGWSAVPPGQ